MASVYCCFQLITSSVNDPDSKRVILVDGSNRLLRRHTVWWRCSRIWAFVPSHWLHLTIAQSGPCPFDSRGPGSFGDHLSIRRMYWTFVHNSSKQDGWSGGPFVGFTYSQSWRGTVWWARHRIGPTRDLTEPDMADHTPPWDTDWWLDACARLAQAWCMPNSIEWEHRGGFASVGRTLSSMLLRSFPFVLSWRIFSGTH